MVYMCVCIYIYIYRERESMLIIICRQGGRETRRPGETVTGKGIGMW